MLSFEGDSLLLLIQSFMLLLNRKLHFAYISDDLR